MSNEYFQNDEETSKSTAPESDNLMMRPPDDWDDPPIDPPPPSGDQFSPTGWLDSVDSGYVSGWSYDPDNPSLSNDVHIYIGGPAGSGAAGYAVTANQPRPDVNQAFGISGDHGFSFQIPAQYANGHQYAVYAYGIDTGANSPALLQGCPKYFILNPSAPAVSLNQVSPLAGSIAGGLSVTLTGSGFQPGAAVYFGNSPATQVSVESGEVIRATSPAAPGTGSVSVSVINPDGSSATMPGGFTYVASESGDQAEVIGVTPLAVIEDTNTVVTIRGRNLIQAYNTGVLALRGPSRCQITFLGTTTSHDQATGVDTVQMNVNIKCSPALQPLERMAIQVLASRRPEAASDGVVESSKQMFTVLPKAVPVTLAYTANLQAGQPNLVMVSGRNLDGHSLALDDGTEVAFQKNDGNFLSGIVTLPEYVDTSQPLQLSMLDAGGTKVAEYQMEVMPLDNGFSSLSSDQAYASSASSSDELAVNLTPAPNQQFIGPTANDSAAFSVQSGSPFGWGFNWWNYEITILDVTIILPIVNEVYLIPFFDGGGDALNSPVVAEVGKIFRLRGAGLLVAVRVEVRIHIQVVLIIGFYYQIWNYGFYNEFPEYGWSIGSMVIGIRTEIQVLFTLSAMIALVKPNGQMQVLAAINLTLGIDFSIDSDGRLHFDPDFTYKPYVIGISPAQNNPLPCGGKFELLTPYGSAAVADAYGFEAQYAVHQAGDCCLPWDFNVRLLRFTANGQQEVVQEGFQTSYCLTAVQPPAIEIEPKLAYLDANGNLVPATDSSGNEVIERLEPHEAKREYVLAAKITSLPPGINKDVKITFPAVAVAMNPASPLSLVNGRPAFPGGNRNSTLISDFFTGNLINKTNLTLTIPNGADLSKLYAFKDGTNNATFAPNQFEDGTKLVIPGINVTGKETSLSVTLEPGSASSAQKPVSDSGNPVNLSKKVVQYSVKNEETYEEYYRVFKEIRSILHENQTTNPTQTALSNFAKDFQAELTANGFNNLKTRGQNLWKLGYQFVQGIGATAGVTDDRLLYYARLEAIAVLRNYCRRRNPSITLTDENLNLFELSSRGLETNGTNAYIKFEAGETNRVVVTGFDPFQLYFAHDDINGNRVSNLQISNSSGLIALNRHQKPIVAGKTFTVRTAVLPVRFRDFDAGLVENIMKQAVGDSELIMTCSWTPNFEFRIDRFAARIRSLGAPDNEGDTSKTSANPFGSTAPFFLESTLPYTAPGVLGNGKQVGSPNPIYLLLDQSFVQASHSHPDPTVGSLDSYQPITGSKLPKPEPMTVGSGGSYLSNEIFYRTSKVRASNRPTLPSGHLHVPNISITPRTSGPSLVKGAEDILKSLLPHAASISGTIQVVFPETEINSSGVAREIIIEVPANYTKEVKISAVEFSQPPSAFTVVSFPANPIPAGTSATVQVKFVPTEVKEYTDTLKLKAADGLVLHTVELKGKGISPPLPIITGFYPTSGPAGTIISIYGENLADAMAVRIGNASVMFYVVSPNEISADIDWNVSSGVVEVDTPFGTAVSSMMFYRTWGGGWEYPIEY